MAKLFDSYSRIVPTWLAAAKTLDQTSGRTAENYVLEIPDITTVTAEDIVLLHRVDEVLASNNQYPIMTVAGTIFPLGVAKRHPDREQFYAAYKRLIKRGKAQSTWGTYFGRMIERPKLDGHGTINPLEMLIRRLSPNGSHGGTHYTSCYELGISEPEVDLVAGDVPTFTCELDGQRWYGGPCLSHLSFKKIRVGTESHLDLTAIYRSHHYCARALGNLIGLSQLISFVSTSAGLQPGTLTCVSTHAELDIASWGGRC